MTLAPDLLAREIADLKRRITGLERASQIANSSVPVNGSPVRVVDGISAAFAAEVAAADALDKATAAEAKVDGVVRSFYGNAADTSTAAPGDFWRKDNGDVFTFDGTSWLPLTSPEIRAALDAAAEAEAAVDGKISTYYRPTTDPPTATGIGDLWFVVDAGNLLRRWDGLEWEIVRDADIATALSTATTASSTASSAQSAASAASTAASNASTAASNARAVADSVLALTSPWKAADSVSIDGGKIFANTITAAQIKAGTITAASGIIASLDAAVISTGVLAAGRIGAGTIDATKLSATAIDGKTITGATLRTAATGERVEVASGTLTNGNEITFYGDNGAVGGAIRSDPYAEWSETPGDLGVTLGTRQIRITPGISTHLHTAKAISRVGALQVRTNTDKNIRADFGVQFAPDGTAASLGRVQGMSVYGMPYESGTLVDRQRPVANVDIYAAGAVAIDSPFVTVNGGGIPRLPTNVGKVWQWIPPTTYTANSTGYFTVPHDLEIKPSTFFAVQSGATGSIPLLFIAIQAAATTTTVQFRCFKASDGTAFAGSVAATVIVAQ